MIKPILFLIGGGLLPAAAQIPAFPGAKGFGAYATGGRGGDVYQVINLNADGEGSLRHGIETVPSAGRTIVFNVSGYIPLPGKNLRIVKPKITIAGQTAPGDGIGLRNGTVRITGDNTVIRNLRIRHGKGGSGGDCLDIDHTATNSIIDHVTMQFSTDENISFFKSALDNFTMQNSVTAWGMERHNAGGLWDLNHGSCINSLWAHHHTRNPKARPNGMLEWVNNVSYDWGIGFIMGDSQTPAAWKANVRSCYFLMPGGGDRKAFDKPHVASDGKPTFSLFLEHCLYDADGDGRLNGTDKGYAIVGGSEYKESEHAAPGADRYIKASQPFPGATGKAAVTPDDPLTAYKKVVSDSGAVRLDATAAGPLRDEVDTVLFNNVVSQKSSRLSSEKELAAAPYNVSNDGFGALETKPSSADTDLDGMPDFWEQSLGFNPKTANNNAVIDNNRGTFLPPDAAVGYTQLEEYLHFLSIPHAVVTDSNLTIDLRKFTAGFSKSPAFKISDITGGTIEQLAENGTTRSATGPIVKFVATAKTQGRAQFNFTVLDADRSTWTRQFGILVAPGSRQ
ncbi:MAG: hypothetical protein ABIS50_05055 [Luteolibacter sp.]|uniref:hypothetical protein n=1 Tax=Luteolibacter sp. TaxID=1962973 RepID=UPI0032671843